MSNPARLVPILTIAMSLTPIANAQQPIDHRDLSWYPDPAGQPRPISTPADWEKRRAATLAAMQMVMGPLPDRSHLPPLDLQTTESFQGQGYTRHTVSFANLHAERVTAYLYVPDNIPSAQRRPAAIAPQPTGPEGKAIADGRGRRGMQCAYALELARRGYLVVAPDYPSFGDQTNYDFAKSNYASGTMKAISDNMRCVDLLLSRPDVDPNRIASIGHSLGGHNTLFTAAFDPRIAACVTSCGWTPFHHYYGGKKLVNWAQDRYMPRVRDVYGSDPDRMPFDFAELIAAIAPRPVLSISPTNDENFDVAGVRLASEQIRKVYALLGAPANYVLETPDYDHAFPDEYRRKGYEFLDAHFHFTPAVQVP